jgi:integrase/recombinase XerD
MTGLATVYRRGRVYWVRFRANGHHVRRSAHSSSKTEAVAFLRQLLIEYAAKARGDSPRHRYEEAVERFFSEAAITPGTRLAYRGSHRAFHPLAQSRYLDEIDRGMLGEFISRRKQAGTMDPTIRGDLAFLSSLCAAAVRGMAGPKSGHGSQQKSAQDISASDPISYPRRT